MKLYLIPLLTALCCYSASAQNSNNRPQRNISIEIIGEDSVKLSYDGDFALIEDSCSQITRHGHLTQDRFFNGKFEDVSSSNPKQVITTGTYANGLKQGPFVINYPNGILQAKGDFKDNLFDGKWEMFYEDGKPKFSFKATGTDIQIIDAWDAKGVKTVDNGKGLFRADLGVAYWKGKLLNGKPDGTWKSKKTSDNEDINTESFKNGVFQQGSNSYGDYTNASRLMLVSADIFKFVQAERFLISRYDCNTHSSNTTEYAHYTPGNPSGAERVANLISNYFTTSREKVFYGTVILSGEIDKNGVVQKIHQTSGSLDAVAVHEIIGRLYTLPNFKPATVDNKPVKQTFTVTVTINKDDRFNVYFQLLPIENN